jgi:hypothetical protein
VLLKMFGHIGDAIGWFSCLRSPFMFRAGCGAW